METILEPVSYNEILNGWGWYGHKNKQRCQFVLDYYIEERKSGKKCSFKECQNNIWVYGSFILGCNVCHEHGNEVDENCELDYFC